MPRTLDQILDSFTPEDRAEVEADAERMIRLIRVQQARTTNEPRHRPIRDRSAYPLARRA